MPTPEKPDLDYSYTAFQQAQGDNAFPGTQLDNDLANIVQSLDETIDFVSQVIRPDGKLNNGTVTKESLDETLLLGLAPPRQWVTGTAYAVDDTVFTGNTLYICVIAHTAGTFATDLAVGRWQGYATFEPLSSISDGSVTEPKHATGGVSTRALADGSVTTAKQADGSVTAAKLAAAVQALLVPVGTEASFSGVFPPSGWMFRAGQALSRVTYAALFGVLCPTVLVTTASGSATLTGLTVNLVGLGVEGAAVEGTGIPTGATIASVTSTSITLSTNATASNTGILVRLFPNGNGDGSTTFTLPDDRDRVEIGRGNMGGTAAGRVTTVGAGTSGIDTSRIGAAGGVDRHTVSVVEMPNHGHGGGVTIGDPGHAHTYSDSGYNSGAGVGSSYNVGGTPAVVEQGRGTGVSGTGISASLSISANGGGQAHQNVQPSRVTNKIIFTGVV